MSLGFRLWSKRQFVNSLEVQFTSTKDRQTRTLALRFGELPQMLYIVYSQRLGGYLCLCILWPCEHKHRLMLAKT